MKRHQIDFISECVRYVCGGGYSPMVSPSGRVRFIKYDRSISLEEALMNQMRADELWKHYEEENHK